MQDYIIMVEELGTSTEHTVGRSLDMLEQSLVDFATKGKLDVHSLVNYMISEFLRLAVIRPMLTNLFGFLGFGGGSSGGGGGGFGADFAISDIVTAASGGSLAPNSVAQVNERGPELLAAGGKTYLMTGSQGGTVLPNDRVGGKTVNVTIAPSIKIDARSDAGQIAGYVQAALAQSQRQMMEELHAQGAL
jgi:hypothetical protein